MTILNNRSLWQRIQAMPEGDNKQFLLDKYDYLSRYPDDRWIMHRRQDQIPPADNRWDVWVYSGGRGAGKTRTGVEEVCAFAEQNKESRLLIITPTRDSLRSTILEGESGIFARYEGARYPKPEWWPSTRTLKWSNGSKALIFAAEDLIDTEQEWGHQYSALRGVQAHLTWVEEPAAWQFPLDYDESDLTLWDEIRFGTRLGSQPRIIVTTTPNDSVMTRAIHKNMQQDPVSVRLTEVPLFANSSNMPQQYVDYIMSVYEDTKIADQEINGRWPWKH